MKKTLKRALRTHFRKIQRHADYVADDVERTITSMPKPRNIDMEKSIEELMRYYEYLRVRWDIPSGR